MFEEGLKKLILKDWESPVEELFQYDNTNKDDNGGGYIPFSMTPYEILVMVSQELPEISAEKLKLIEKGMIYHLSNDYDFFERSTVLYGDYFSKPTEKAYFGTYDNIKKISEIINYCHSCTNFSDEYRNKVQEFISKRNDYFRLFKEAATFLMSVQDGNPFIIDETRISYPLPPPFKSVVN